MFLSGDVIIGDATLYLGNCRDRLRCLSEGRVDLTVTSPPYDGLRAYNGYSFDFEPIARELFRVTKDGGVLVWVVADETRNFQEFLSSFRQAIYLVETCGFGLLDTMIYQKNGGPSPYPGMRRYAPWFEYMFVFAKGRPKTFNPIKDRANKYAGVYNSGNTARQRDGSMKPTGGYTVADFSIRTNVWTYDVGKNKDTKDAIAMTHPARFPEALAHDHIASWSNPNDIVLDPFMGSGTTGKMALLARRKFVGIEISEEYMEIAKSRLGATLIDDGHFPML